MNFKKFTGCIVLGRTSAQEQLGTHHYTSRGVFQQQKTLPTQGKKMEKFDPHMEGKEEKTIYMEGKNDLFWF